MFLYMKKVIMFIVALAATVHVSAQMPGRLEFVGDGSFWLPAMSDLPKTVQKGDVVSVTLGSEGLSSITLPQMAYTAMGVTVSSFTIADARWKMDMSTMVSTWEEQNFTATAVGTDGNSKAVSGKMSAEYVHNDKTFHIILTFKYGSMPFEIVYEHTGVYVSTAIDAVDNDVNASVDGASWTVSGQRVSSCSKGLLIRNGRKYLVK